MLTPWNDAPGWVLGVVMGALFALGMGLFSTAQGQPWPSAATGAAVAGVLFGAVMGPYAARSRRRARAAVDGGGEALRSAQRSLRWRGGRPDDEGARLARVQLAQHRLEVLEGQRVWGTTLFVALSVVAGWFAVTRSPWWWLEVVFFAAVVVVAWLQRRRLRQIVAGGA